MKTTSKQLLRSTARTATGARHGSNDGEGLFLGHKLLDELRILMRLAGGGMQRARASMRR